MPFRHFCIQRNITEISNSMRMSAISLTLMNARRSSCFVSSRDYFRYPQTSSSLPSLDDTVHEIRCSPTKRCLHQSPVFHRKRKSRTPDENERRFDETTTGDGIDEEQEYGDEAIKYANELVNRGHQGLQGHCVLVIQPVIKTERRHKSDSELKMIEAQSLVTVGIH